jgi:hypothetical protein
MQQSRSSASILARDPVRPVDKHLPAHPLSFALHTQQLPISCEMGLVISNIFKRSVTVQSHIRIKTNLLCKTSAANLLCKKQLG